MHHTKHHSWVLSFVVIVLTLTIVTPVLAEYIGPQRTVTETNTVCRIVLNECRFVEDKQEWKYKTDETWSCSLESKPWQAYSSDSRPCNDTLHTPGYQYWSREEDKKTETVTYPPATISGSLQNCTLRNGWCITVPQLALTGLEPVAGYRITAVEGTLNGKNFACTGANCSVSLKQGNNNFTYWALSSFLDSSEMGTFTTKVDSQPPKVTSTLSGIAGSNGWYLGPVSLNNTATDATSGVEIFACRIDGVKPGNCNVMSITGEGLHTVLMTARDYAGHLHSITLNPSVDTQNPELIASVNGTRGSNDWYTSATLEASAIDPSPGSGISVFEYNYDGSGWAVFPTSGTLDLADGKHTVDLRAADVAGRTVSSSTSFWLDTAAPNVSLDSSGTFGQNDWYITNPTLTVSASDDTSGLDLFEYSLNNSAWTPYTEPLRLTDGIHTISFWAQDQAGLVTQVDRTYQVDTRPPQIAGSLSGILGANGWYISEVTLSASASDPMPGSDIGTFTYTMNGSAETPYAEPITLSDGQHIIQFNTWDKAGLSHSIQESFKVDTLPPSLTIDTALPIWVRGTITINGISGDNGSGLSAVEISFDGAQNWQAVTGTDTWDFAWNTADSPNGSNAVSVRTSDQAGLTTQQTVNISVDNRPPEINLPDSWLQWDTVMLNIWDDHSGLSEARVEISDPKGRWPTRVLMLDPGQFPLGFKWDRRFGDNTIAEAGTYDVKVFAVDHLGNASEQNASIRVLLDILPPGPISTKQFATPTEPVLPATAAPTNKVKLTSSPTATQTTVIRIFGTIEPPMQATQTSFVTSTPRATPTQSNAVERLQTIFGPDPGEESTTEVTSTEENKDSTEPVSGDDSVLWGTAATAAIASAMAYAEEQKRKREEEKARLKALEEAKEERRKKMKARKTAKMDAKRAQESAWEQARLEAQEQISDRIAMKLGQFEAEENAKWVDFQETVLQREIEKKQAEREKKKADEQEAKFEASIAPIQHKEDQETPKKELNWWEKTKSFISENIVQPVNTHIYQPLIKPAIEKISEATSNTVSWLNQNVYQPHIQPTIERSKEFIDSEFAWINENLYEPYTRVSAKVNDAVLNITSPKGNESSSKPKKKNWLDKTADWIDQHQTEIALGIGVLAGATVIVLSGGLATPLVALALAGSAALAAGGTAALGTIALNAHYDRPLNQNLLKNLALAGGAAAVVSGGWFLFHAASTGIGAYCATHQSMCANVEPVFKALDTVEETWLNAKLAYQTWSGDESGAAETAFEIHSEYIDGGMPGNSVANELGDQLADLSEDAAFAITRYGDDVIPLLVTYGDDALEIIQKYGDDGIALLQKYGTNAVELINDFGEPAIKVMKAVDPKAAKKLLESLDDDVLDYAIQQGPDAVDALSRWTAEELSLYGPELALRANKDAKVLTDVKKLISSGPIDPKNLTKEQKALIDAIAANSTQYADEGQVVLGKWVDYGSGFVETAQDTGSVHYNPHLDMWNMLSALGTDRGEAAWLINQQVIQTGIERGLPFEYTLNGIPNEILDNEHEAIEAIFTGKSDDEIIKIMKAEKIPIRMKELQELQKAGYEISFDDVNNSYVLVHP